MTPQGTRQAGISGLARGRSRPSPRLFPLHHLLIKGSTCTFPLVCCPDWTLVPPAAALRRRCLRHRGGPSSLAWHGDPLCTAHLHFALRWAPHPLPDAPPFLDPPPVEPMHAPGHGHQGLRRLPLCGRARHARAAPARTRGRCAHLYPRRSHPHLPGRAQGARTWICLLKACYIISCSDVDTSTALRAKNR